VLDELAVMVKATCLLVEADSAIARDLPPLSPDLLALYFNRHLRPAYDPMGDAEYLARLARLAEY
jgi:hypothetical protein